MSDETPILLAYGNFEYKTSLEFVLALSIALGVVFLFSLRKFGESTLPRDEDDLVTQLLPRHLATRQQYSRAHMFYVAIMAMLVVGLSMLGPKIIGGIGGVEVPNSHSALPLFVALVLVGALPNVPWLLDIEKALRGWAHRKAFIPKAVQTDSTRLMRADFDFAPFRSPEVMTASTMRGVSNRDFDQPRGSIEHGWARLSCIVHRLGEVQNGSLADSLDEDVLRSYAKDVDSFFLRRKALEDEVTTYRKKRAKNPDHENAELKQRIDRTLRHLYVLLACGVRLRRGNNDISASLQRFGFELAEEQNPGNDNLIVLSCGIVAVIAFVMVQAAIWMGQLAVSFDLWTPSVYFPAARFEPFPWAVSLLSIHGTAIALADFVRRRRLSRGTWFRQARSEHQRVYANYLRIAVLCALAGSAVLFVWGAVFRGFSLGLAMEQIPYAVLPAVTGMFFVFALDSIELKHGPSRATVIAAQALCTGFFGFIAADVWLASFAQTMSVHDLPVFVAVLNALVGAGLAWFVAKAAAPRVACVTSVASEHLTVAKPEPPAAFGRDVIAIHASGRRTGRAPRDAHPQDGPAIDREERDAG